MRNIGIDEDLIVCVKRYPEHTTMKKWQRENKNFLMKTYSLNERKGQ